MKKLMIVCLLFVIAAAGFSVYGQVTGGYVAAVETTAQAAIVETFVIKKTPMEHTDTLAFSWTTPFVLEANAIDYLAPQLPEIFDVAGIEHEGQFWIHDELAKRAPDNFNTSTMRLYNVMTKEKWNGLPLLVCTQNKNDEVHVFVQAVSTFLFLPYSNDFWFADFDGDGIEEVFATTGYGFADRGAATVGVFPFSEEGWGKPLFWSYTTEKPLPYDYGWELLGETDFYSEEMHPYTIKNKRTGYSREFEDDGWTIYNDTLEGAEVGESASVDVDGDGVYELIVLQSPWRWPGECFSLLRYNTKKKCFKTECAAFLLYGEYGNWTDGNEAIYGPFLKQAGYNIKDVTFIN